MRGINGLVSDFEFHMILRVAGIPTVVRSVMANFLRLEH